MTPRDRDLLPQLAKNEVLKIILNRLGVLVPTVLFGSVLIFAMVQLIPGGAAEAVLGPEASPAQIAKLEAEMGLDRPLVVQYGGWLSTVARGDLGRSLIDHRSIAEDIAHRLPITLELTSLALLVAMLIGVPLGIVSAVNHHTRIDRTITGVSGLGLAVPEFWLAMLCVNLFALKLAWLPAIGIEPLEAGLGEHLRSLVLPVLTLASGAAAAIIRFTRNGMIEALQSSYVRTAWALGLPARQIYFRFALKNAMVTVVTVVGLIGGHLLGGAVLVEQVFVIPGLGAMLVNGTLQKDFPTVQAVALALTIPVVLINLVVDLVCATLDPRTRR